MDKSLRVKLIIVSLLERHLNQQISLFNVRSFNSTRKVNVNESFVSSKFKLDTALRQAVGIFYHCNFAESLFASMCLGKNYMMPFFASGHRLG